MRVHWLFVSLFILESCLHSTASAAPQIANRMPKPNEIGYRPAEGSVARLNPPPFIWLHETEAKTYCIQWSEQKDFSQAATAEPLPFNTYTHSAPLKPGMYYWRYCFTDKKGARSNWSQTRTVTVPADAVEFPMPTRAQQRERVPQDHPRLFMRPEDLPRLRELARGREAERFNALRKEADKIMKGEPTPEPKERGTARDSAMRKFWWPNRETALKACGEAETLAFVYLITQEKKYGEAARKWILQLATWDPDGPTNFSLNDEAAMPMLHRP
ncbi:MAG: DUF4962 domain-containing protein, partial [Candidatus Sumerlaeota bacterium]|nr:DUF4962 domain-containing protein [Candidatus Sumerlaeota bacterium]